MAHLYYFTNSYPYGIGENWKDDELTVLCDSFESVTVIPFSYAGNSTSPRKLPAGVQLEDPLFENEGFQVKPYHLAKLIGRGFLKSIFELVRSGAFMRRKWIAAWLQSCLRAKAIIAHPTIKKLLAGTPQKSAVWFFFWGRGACEMLPFSRPKRDRVVVRYHGFDLYAERAYGYQPFQKPIVDTADFVTCISEHGRSYLTRHYRDQDAKVRVHRLGVHSTGRSCASQDGVFRIVSCSSLIPLKRVHLIAQALQGLEGRIEWTHIGDGPERGRIESEIAKLPNNVNAKITGWVLATEVALHYVGQPVDVYLHVSETEGVPVAIMESFAAGVPVISTDVGGVSELVDDTNGVLLKENVSIDELAQNIRQFMDLTPVSREKRRDAAFKRFADRADATANATVLAQDLVALETQRR